MESPNIARNESPESVAQARKRVRLESLDAVRAELKSTAAVESADRFAEVFAQAREVLEIDDATLARELRISRPTVGRWARGTSAPHPLGRGPALELLLRHAESKLRRLRATG